MSIGVGLIAGVLAGTTVGLLCAPQPGRETRGMIWQKTAGYVGAVRRRFGRSRDTGEAVSLTYWG
jgi:gas vesicle protein